MRWRRSWAKAPTRPSKIATASPPASLPPVRATCPLSKVVGPLRSYTLLRRAPVTALQIESRLLGAMETAGGGPGTLPQIVRDAFFFANGKLGVAAQVFVKGARPWV